MRARLRLDPRLLGRLVAREYLFDEGVEPPLALHSHRSTLADPELDTGARAAIEDVDQQVGRAGIVLRDRRADQLAHAQVVADFFPGPMKLAVENDADLPRVRLLGGLVAGRARLPSTVRT